VWCGRAVAARLLPQQPPSGRAAAGRTPTGAAPAAAWRRGSNRFEAGQQPSRGLTDAARQPRGSCLARAAPAQLLPRQEAPAKNCKFPGTLSARCRLRRLAANGLLAFSKTAALGVSEFRVQSFNEQNNSKPTKRLALRRHASFEAISRDTRSSQQPSMQDTLPEGTARATQLAPSAVTASAVGGSANISVVGRVSPTTNGSSNCARTQPCCEPGEVRCA
jgi:hypothetical protein